MKGMGTSSSSCLEWGPVTQVFVLAAGRGFVTRLSAWFPGQVPTAMPPFFLFPLSLQLQMLGGSAAY